MTQTNLKTDKDLTTAAAAMGATVRAVPGWNEYRVTFPGQPVETVDRGHTIADKIEARREALAMARRMSKAGTPELCESETVAAPITAAPKVLNIAPRWAGLMPSFMAIMESGDSEGRAMVSKELTRLAEWADSQIATQEAAARGPMTPPATLNGLPVLSFVVHKNCATVALVRGADTDPAQTTIIATWWPDLGTSWSWGHYLRGNMSKAARGCFDEVSARNENR